MVVANAGVASRGATVRAMNGEAFDRVLAVDLGGVYNTVIAGLDQVAGRSGHIVLTSSVYAFLNGLGLAPYAMAKAGVEQLGRALRVELVPHGASASVAYFGFIDTEMVHRGIDQDPLAAEDAQGAATGRCASACRRRRRARRSRGGSRSARRGSSRRSGGRR